jgi:hypothetical protein
MNNDYAALLECIVKAVFTPMFLLLLGFATLGDEICYVFFVLAAVSIVVSIACLFWIKRRSKR